MPPAHLKSGLRVSFRGASPRFAPPPSRWRPSCLGLSLRSTLFPIEFLSSRYSPRSMTPHPGLSLRSTTIAMDLTPSTPVPRAPQTRKRVNSKARKRKRPFVHKHARLHFRKLTRLRASFREAPPRISISLIELVVPLPWPLFRVFFSRKKGTLFCAN